MSRWVIRGRCKLYSERTDHSSVLRFSNRRSCGLRSDAASLGSSDPDISRRRDPNTPLTERHTPEERNPKNRFEIFRTDIAVDSVLTRRHWGHRIPTFQGAGIRIPHCLSVIPQKNGTPRTDLFTFRWRQHLVNVIAIITRGTMITYSAHKTKDISL